MKAEEIYKTKDKEFLNLIELLEEIKKDEDEIKPSPLTNQNNLVDVIFNPLLKKYYSLKDTFLKAQQEGKEGYTTESFWGLVTKMIREQPNYEEALEYFSYKEELIDKTEESELYEESEEL